MGEADSYYSAAANQSSNPPRGFQQQPPLHQQQQPPPFHQQQQQYHPQDQAPEYYNQHGSQTGFGLGEKSSFEQAFQIHKPKWNDLWAGILFIVFFLGFVAVSGLTLAAYRSNGPVFDSTNSFTLSTSTVLLFVFVLVVAVVLSFAYIWLARLFPKQFIWVTGILNICWAVGTAVFYFWRRYWSAAIVFTIFAVFLIFAFWTWISRIPFSALMLKTSVDVSKKFGHTYLVSFIGGIVAMAFGAWYAITLVGIHMKYAPVQGNTECGSGGCSQGTVIGLIAFVTFAMYWISEWIKNTIHVTISGVYGSWYFYPHNPPSGATRGAAKRALTYSFGSICLGSLLVAIVQFMRQICSVARSQARSEGGVGGILGYVLFCILGCIISLLEWAIQFLNRYAFSHIALYGKAYIPAAKDTWKMIKDRGIDALVNECLIGPVLSFGAIFIAYACTLLAYLYLFFTKPFYNSDGDYTPFILAFSFLIGFQIAHIVTTPLSSGIDTIFVAAGWDPMVLWREHPELYAEMVRVYPKVQQVIQDR